MDLGAETEHQEKTAEKEENARANDDLICFI